MEPIVQVSIDLTTIEEALQVAEVAVRAGVDWLEAGTPLILGEGAHAVRALRERSPGKPIVADIKTMDAGYLETEMMVKAGATHVVVMGVACPATIKAAVRAKQDYDVEIMGDVMGAPDKVACAKMMEEMGVDTIIVHTGFDERNDPDWDGRTPLDDLPPIVEAVTIPCQAVGGLSVEHHRDARVRRPARRGRRPARYRQRGVQAQRYRRPPLLREIVTRVKGAS